MNDLNLANNQLRTSPDKGRWCRRFLLITFLTLIYLSIPPQPALAHPEDAAELGPFVVYVSLAVLDIPNIDEPSETYDLDAYLSLKWTDPTAYGEIRQEFSPGTTYLSGSTDEALQTLKDIGWFYIVEIANQVGPRSTIMASLKIQPDGNIEYMERLQVTLRSEYKLKMYPFDSQKLRIRIESFAYDATKMTFKDDRIIFYRALESAESRLVLEDWKLPREISREYGVSHSLLFDSDWPYIEIMIEAQRNFGYHIWKIFLPLILIISITWSVFWIGRENVGTRLSISLIGFLTAISFNFFISTNLPEISYLTLMDFCIIGIYVFMTLTVVVVIATHIFSNYDKVAIASRINIHARWLFPVCLAAYLLIVALMI
jgi:hypothetical protein